MKETDIAAPVVAWLTEQEWDVYQEVQIPIRSAVADIVAKYDTGAGNTLIWVVEVKKSLSLALLDQAVGWTPWANYVSIAVPKLKQTFRRYRSRPRVVNHILRHYGIGQIQVKDDLVKEDIVAPLHRRNKKLIDWDKVLCPERKTACAAGTKGGGYWTPFKATCRELLYYVERHPGCTLKAAIDSIDHHYHSAKSARASLADLVKKGAVPYIRYSYDGSGLVLYSTRTKGE